MGFSLTYVVHHALSKCATLDFSMKQFLHLKTALTGLTGFTGQLQIAKQ